MFVIILLGCSVFAFLKGIKKGMAIQIEKDKKQFALLSAASAASDLDEVPEVESI